MICVYMNKAHSNVFKIYEFFSIFVDDIYNNKKKEYQSYLKHGKIKTIHLFLSNSLKCSDNNWFMGKIKQLTKLTGYHPIQFNVDRKNRIN